MSCKEGKRVKELERTKGQQGKDVVFSGILSKRQNKYLFIKRLLDIVIASMAVILLSPLFALLSLAIKLDSAGPVLFKQNRVGKDKQLFQIWKFRTMKVDAPKDTPTHLLENADNHITKIGRFLRKTSLDELPQLFQCIAGKMSLIGPRPALWNQDDLVMERDKYGANAIRPGMTGWAQINGRDELEISEKAALDGYYLNNLGFYIDIKCFFGTIISVLTKSGIVEGGTGEIKRRANAGEGR